MRSMKIASHAAHAATAAIFTACALSMSVCIGCEEEDEEPTPAPAQSEQRPFDQPPAGGSKSAYGKARDAAVSVRDRMQERDAEIGKMADDVFKTSPPSETPQETPE